MSRSRKLNEFGLTQQQEHFCHAYIRLGIAYRAYLEAYPAARNWKRASADRKASAMLENVRVQARLTQLNSEAEKKLLNSCTISKRKLLEAGVQALNENQKTNPNFTALLKLLLQQQGYMAPATPQIQVNVQNNAVLGDVTKYLDL